LVPAGAAGVVGFRTESLIPRTAPPDLAD
jgi:hypothetical protein